MNNIIKFKNQSNFDRDLFYSEQYNKAINILLFSPNAKNTFLPIINIILQQIENDLKSLIIEYDLFEESAKDLNLQHHNLEKLIEDELLFEKFKKHKDFIKIYHSYKKEILYFYSLLGNYTFLNSRYPIKSNVQKPSISTISLNVNSVRKHWSKYLKLSSYVYKIFNINYLYNSIMIEKRITKMNLKKILLKCIKDFNINLNNFDYTRNPSYTSILNSITNKDEKLIVKYIIKLLKECVKNSV